MVRKIENSKIEWTDHTFNPWIGCQHVSPGCDHCYAEAMMDHRYGKVEWGPHALRKWTSEENWRNPLKWNADARAFKREHGRRMRVFCASLADVFDNQVPTKWRQDLFALIRQYRRLDWLMLTKRPQNILKMLPADWAMATAMFGLARLLRTRHILIAVGVFCNEYLPSLDSFPCSYRNTALTRIG
jgi:protein gp37